MATYAIGDVQGCGGALEALMDKVAFARGRDKLWFVGDLVNRGPQSLEVLRLVKGLGDDAVTVLGNHDLHLIAVAAGVAAPRRGDTLNAILEAPDRDELMRWLRTRRLAYREYDWLMVHAGLLPQWQAADVLRLAAEVETVLASATYAAFLATMYGDQPSSWNESLRGADRLRVIVNAMTRMRFCSDKGEMQLEEKGGAANAPPGYRPWFDAPGRASAGLTVICGHWSALGYVQKPNLIALDSGCVWGGRLTAVRLEDRAAIQTACEPEVRPGPKQ